MGPKPLTKSMFVFKRPKDKNLTFLAPIGTQAVSIVTLIRQKCQFFMRVFSVYVVVDIVRDFWNIYGQGLIIILLFGENFKKFLPL